MSLRRVQNVALAVLIVFVAPAVFVQPAAAEAGPAAAQSFPCYRYDADYDKVQGTCAVGVEVAIKNLIMAVGRDYEHPVTIRVYDPQDLVSSIDLTMYAADGSIHDTGYVNRFTSSGAYKTFTYTIQVYQGMFFADPAGRFRIVATAGFQCCGEWRTDAPEPSSGSVAYAVLYGTKTFLWAGPSPVPRGQTLTLFGRVSMGRDPDGQEWVPKGGSATFYFRRADSTTWVRQGTVGLAGRAVYVKTFTAKTTGIWKVVYNGTGGTAKSSAARGVHVR